MAKLDEELQTSAALSAQKLAQAQAMLSESRAEVDRQREASRTALAEVGVANEMRDAARAECRSLATRLAQVAETVANADADSGAKSGTENPQSVAEVPGTAPAKDLLERPGMAAREDWPARESSLRAELDLQFSARMEAMSREADRREAALRERLAAAEANAEALRGELAASQLECALATTAARQASQLHNAQR